MVKKITFYELYCIIKINKLTEDETDSIIFSNLDILDFDNFENSMLQIYLLKFVFNLVSINLGKDWRL